MSNKTALEEAKDILYDIKELVSLLNVFVAKHNLLPLNEIAPEMQALCTQGKKPLTSILEISIACDEQLGELDDYANTPQNGKGKQP